MIDPDYNISIHTPARGVTVGNRYKVEISEISIHTPARGVTKPIRRFGWFIEFQSTLPHGE